MRRGDCRQWVSLSPLRQIRAATAKARGLAAPQAGGILRENDAGRARTPNVAGGSIMSQISHVIEVPVSAALHARR